MSYSEDLMKLKNRLLDVTQSGKESKDVFNAILNQILNDAEKSRQNCLMQADTLKKQAIMLEGQANAFSSVINMIYNAINGYASAAENFKKIEVSVEESLSDSTDENK